MKNVEIKLVNIEEEDDYNYYFFDILNDGQTVGRAIVTAPMKMTIMRIAS